MPNLCENECMRRIKEKNHTKCCDKCTGRTGPHTNLCDCVNLCVKKCGRTKDPEKEYVSQYELGMCCDTCPKHTDKCEKREQNIQNVINLGKQEKEEPIILEEKNSPQNIYIKPEKQEKEKPVFCNISIASFNVLYDYYYNMSTKFELDQKNKVNTQRKKAFLDVLQKHLISFDIICLQEFGSNWNDILRDVEDKYNIFDARDSKYKNYEGLVILYNKNKIKLISHKTVLYSNNKNAIQICEMQCIGTDNIFMVINTHMPSYKSDSNSSSYFQQQIIENKILHSKYFICGDFNITDKSQSFVGIISLLKNTQYYSGKNYNNGNILSLDHIFTNIPNHYEHIIIPQDDTKLITHSSQDITNPILFPSDHAILGIKPIQSGGNDYYHKYIKYKNKYLSLQKLKN